MSKPDTHTVAGAIYASLNTPNELDSNFEAANIVDGLFEIARAIRSLAEAVATHGRDTNCSG